MKFFGANGLAWGDVAEGVRAANTENIQLKDAERRQREADLRYQDLLAQMDERAKLRPLEYQRLVDEGTIRGTEAKFAPRRAALGMDLLAAQVPSQISQANLTGATAVGELANLPGTLEARRVSDQVKIGQGQADLDLLPVETSARRSKATTGVVQDEFTAAKARSDQDLLGSNAQATRARNSQTVSTSRVAQAQNEATMNLLPEATELQRKAQALQGLQNELQSQTARGDIARVSQKFMEMDAASAARMQKATRDALLAPQQFQADALKLADNIADSKSKQEAVLAAQAAARTRALMDDRAALTEMSQKYNMTPEQARAALETRLTSQVAQMFLIAGKAETAERLGILSEDSLQRRATLAGRYGRISQVPGAAHRSPASKQDAGTSAADKTLPPPDYPNFSTELIETYRNSPALRDADGVTLRGLAMDVNKRPDLRRAAQELLFEKYGEVIDNGG